MYGYPKFQITNECLIPFVTGVTLCFTKEGNTQIDPLCLISSTLNIPLGVSNFHSKNLSQESFSHIEKKQYFLKTKKLMYVNFNPNTNFSHRKNLYSLFEHNQWATNDVKPLKNEDYQKNLTRKIQYLH